VHRHRFATRVGDSERERLSRDGTCLLRTDWRLLTVPCSFAGLTSPRKRQRLPPPCKSSGDSPAYTDRPLIAFRVTFGSRLGGGRRLVPFCFYRHPASVPYACFRLRAKTTLRSRRPGLRSVRSGAVFAFPQSSLRLPNARRCARRNAASAGRLRVFAFHGRVRRVHPARALRHAATSMSRRCSSYSIQGGGQSCEDCGRHPVRPLTLPKFTNRIPNGRHPAKNNGGHPAHPTKKAPAVAS